MVPGRSWLRRLASVVARCPGALTRPVIRRLLITASIAIAGWLLGAAGQAHADTVPGARLPSVAANAERSVTDVGQSTTHVGQSVTDVTAPLVRRVVPAVRTTEADLRPSRPSAILALPPVTVSVKSGAPRSSTPADAAGPSRTRRHGDAGVHAGLAGGPLTHSGQHAVTGASEKAPSASKAQTHVPFMPRMPRPSPHRAQALPPTVDDGGLQVGTSRITRIGAAPRRAAVPAPLTWAVPPAVRTAADEPSFSPD